jgi:3-oxoacyl-[acyl-carrier-protein] synthase III
MKVYITAVSAFLPGLPVDNDTLDTYLGEVKKVSHRTRQIILSNNGIAQRYYALNPETGKATHNNAELSAEAIRRLFPGKDDLSNITECLCCGTSTPDQIMPGHGSMVQAELGVGPCEVITTAGVCLTSLTALKYGAASVALGNSKNAIACGSELTSSFMGDEFFAAMSGKSGKKEKNPRHPAFSFEAEFLRWMLSDGAGAVFLDGCPSTSGLSLQINWIEILSHSHRLETCMYAGGVKREDGSLKGWRECVRDGSLERQGVMTIKQDARLLNEEIINVIVAESLPTVLKKHGIDAEGIDWFIPHYSSDYFRQPLHDKMAGVGFHIPFERWFTNLTTRGNTGSASFYIMLEELFSSGKLKKGDRILGMVPESGRFSVGWLLMTVV